MTRQDVYKALDSERQYQDDMSRRTDRPDMVDQMTMGDILSAIHYNLGLANAAWYRGSVPHETTTQYLRKIGALCIKAGETFGMNGR